MNHPETNFEISLWVSQDEGLPDTCCRCGMFTDHRIKIKHMTFVTKDAGTSIWLILAGFVFSPLGWLLMFLNSSDDDNKTKTVKKSVKFKMPICVLCQGGPRPMVLAYQPQLRRFQIEVHPEFASRYRNLMESE